MNISVVILNWNTRDYLKRWLPGLVGSCRSFNANRTDGAHADVVVADNASTDGSIQLILESFPDVQTIQFDKNYGFTGGYNRALESNRADLFVLLNSDVEVKDGWLEPLEVWMEGHPECAVCGPKILSLKEEGMFEYAGAAGGFIDRFGYPFCRGRVLSRTEEDHGQYDSPANVLWVSGACLMVRSSVWRSLGGFDPGFFAHMEEIDFCWRASLAGYSITIVPSSEVRHLGGGTLSQGSPLKLKLNYRNNLLMLRKNLPRTTGSFKAGFLILGRMVLDGVSAMCYLASGRWSSFKAVLDAHGEYRQMSSGMEKGIRKGTHVAGYKNICIILQSIFRGRHIFEYVNKL